jgi:Domain of unknown function (DUF4397)
MSRGLRVLPLALALAAFGVFAASCGSSSGTAHARFVNAIPDTTQYGPALDINFNGSKEFTNVAFQGMQPPSGYTSVPSGGDTLKGLKTGTTTEVFLSNVSLTTGHQYTLVATGFAIGLSRVVIIPALDDNTSPANGKVEFRAIEASPSGPAAADIYIVPVGTTNPISGSPTIGNVAYGSASGYVTIPFNPNFVAGFNYTMYVTAAGDTTPLITQNLAAGSSSAGAIRTVVLTDEQNVNQLNQLAMVLSDLN